MNGGRRLGLRNDDLIAHVHLRQLDYVRVVQRLFGVSREDVQTDALGFLGLVQQSIALCLRERSRDRVLIEPFQLPRH